MYTKTVFLSDLFQFKCIFLDSLTHSRFNKWLERKAKTAILKDFLAWHVIPNQINNRSHYFNKGDHVVGVMRAQA